MTYPIVSHLKSTDQQPFRPPNFGHTSMTELIYFDGIRCWDGVLLGEDIDFHLGMGLKVEMELDLGM